MARHSTTSNVEWASMHELETIADSLEKMQKNFDCQNGGCVFDVLNRIATALETIAAKP